MHSRIIFSGLALALSSNILAAPIEARQNSITVADTVQFIAKTVGPNPVPGVIPDINNWLVKPAHSGAGLHQLVLRDPTKSSMNVSAPGWFRNGSDAAHDIGGYITAGLSSSNLGVPWSLVEAMHLDTTNPKNTHATIGTLQFNVGTGTSGLDITEDGRLTTSRLLPDRFCASPDVEVEGEKTIGVVALGKYESNPVPGGCWAIELYAQCTGPIADSDRAALPAFVQSPCYLDAASVIGINY